jgi:hypothetical protein
MTDSDSSSLRATVFRLLDKNHELMPKDICKLLDLNYHRHGHYIRSLRSNWKCHYRNRHALKCLSFHNTRGWLYALKSVAREAVLGWVQTRARNKMLLWKDVKLGRLEWHVSGRINVWIKKPASLGRAKQLLADAFFSTGLVKDVQIFDLWANSIRFKGSHLVYDTGERLPYARIDYLKESLGVVIKTGDATHPTAIEVEFHYPDWAERNELLFQQITKAFQQFQDLPQPPVMLNRLNPFIS